MYDELIFHQRDEKHSQISSTKVLNVLHNRKFHDFVIAFGDRKIFAHKIILAAESYFFADVIKNCTKLKENAYKLEFDLNPDVVEQAINYLYSKKVNICQENVGELLKTASLLKIPDLLDHSSVWLSNTLNPENCLDLLQLAKQNDAKILKSIVTWFVMKNFKAFVKKKPVSNFDFNFLNEIVSSANTEVHEDEIFEAIINWTQCDYENRKVHLEGLLEHIGLSNLGLGYDDLVYHLEYSMIEKKESLKTLRKTLVPTNKKTFELKKRKFNQQFYALHLAEDNKWLDFKLTFYEGDLSDAFIVDDKLYVSYWNRTAVYDLKNKRWAKNMKIWHKYVNDSQIPFCKGKFYYTDDQDDFLRQYSISTDSESECMELNRGGDQRIKTRMAISSKRYVYVCRGNFVHCYDVDSGKSASRQCTFGIKSFIEQKDSMYALADEGDLYKCNLIIHDTDSQLSLTKLNVLEHKSILSSLQLECTRPEFRIDLFKFELIDRESLPYHQLVHCGTKSHFKQTKSLPKLYHDFVILCDGVKIPAHKIILIASSDYFEDMLKNDNFNSIDETELKDLDLGAVKLVVNYFYSAFIIINKLNILNITKVASILKVQDLFKECIKRICNYLNLENCFDFLRLGIQYQSSKLKRMATYFILKNSSLIDESLFLNLDFEFMQDYVSNRNLNADEEEIFQIIIKWIHHDAANRQVYFKNLFKHVCLSYLSREYLEKLLDNELVKKSADCIKQVKVALKKNPLTTIPSRRQFNGSFYYFKMRNDSSNDWSNNELIFDRGNPYYSQIINEKLYIFFGDGETYRTKIATYNITEKKWEDDTEVEFLFRGFSRHNENLYFVELDCGYHLVQYSPITKRKSKLINLHVHRGLYNAKIAIFNDFVYVWRQLEGLNRLDPWGEDHIFCRNISDSSSDSKVYSKECEFELVDFVHYEGSMFALSQYSNPYKCNVQNLSDEVEWSKLDDSEAAVVKQFGLNFNAEKTLKIQEHEFHPRNFKGLIYYLPKIESISREI